MKYFAGALLSLTLLSGCAIFKEMPDTNEVMKKVNLANASDERIAAVKKAKLVYLNDDTANSRTVIYYAAPEQFRFDSLSDKYAKSVIYDGKTAYSYSSKKGIVELTPEQVLNLRRSIVALPFDDLSGALVNPKIDDDAIVNGFDCWVIKATIKDQAQIGTVTLYYDKSGYLLRRLQIDDTWCSDFFHYQDYDGIKLPELTIIESGAGMKKYTLYSVDWDCKLIDESTFKPFARLKK